MKMFEVGRLCMKIAGRDAGQKCVIVEVHDNGFVLIDGLTRRRKCNVKHLEPLKSTIKITKGASHDVVAKEFKKLGMDIPEKKSKKPTQRQKRSHVNRKTAKAEVKADKKKPVKKEAKVEKKTEKKETPKPKKTAKKE
jgi:large subunit ribosomal protein L14e